MRSIGQYCLILAIWYRVNEVIMMQRKFVLLHGKINGLADAYWSFYGLFIKEQVQVSWNVKGQSPVPGTLQFTHPVPTSLFPFSVALTSHRYTAA